MPSTTISVVSLDRDLASVFLPSSAGDEYVSLVLTTDAMKPPSVGHGSLGSESEVIAATAKSANLSKAKRA